MSQRGIVRLAACLAAVGGVAFAAGPASGASGIGLAFENWKLSGSLTVKKLNEPVVLPSGSTFNGFAEVTHFGAKELEATLTGKIFVPPFKASLKIAGLIPSTVGVTFTQVGEAEGTLTTASATSPECANARFHGLCILTNVTTKAIVGLTVVGVLGIEVPTQCQTSEPLDFHLTNISTLPELTETGPRFTGTVTIPSITCEGLTGLVLGPAITLVMSGPENPYSLKINKQAPPRVETREASSVSQISAILNGSVRPNGEPLTECHFEYGTSTAYTTSVPCVSPPAAEDRVLARLTGLSEGATYHYRVVASNAIGTSNGADQTFTTLSEAGAPEYGQCVAQAKGEFTEENCQTKASKPNKGKFSFKPGPAPSCVSQKNGEYKDAGCTVKSAKPGKGKFEKAPGPGYTSTTGAVTLETGATKLVCASSTGAGEVTGLRSGVDRITLTGCETAGKKCASEGPNSTPSGKAGVIVSNRLGTKLLGPVSGQVWTELASSEHEPYLAEFSCEGTLFRTKGTVAGVQTGNVNVQSLTSTTTFASEEGEQGLSTERSEDGGKTWVGPASSTLATVATNTAASPTEIRP
jgi:hypothetical protein